MKIQSDAAHGGGNVVSCIDAKRLDDRCSGERPETAAVFGIDRKVFQVPVIDPDHAGSRTECHMDFRVVMCLHQSGETQRVTDGKIF